MWVYLKFGACLLTSWRSQWLLHTVVRHRWYLACATHLVNGDWAHCLHSHDAFGHPEIACSETCVGVETRALPVTFLWVASQGYSRLELLSLAPYIIDFVEKFSLHYKSPNLWVFLFLMLFYCVCAYVCVCVCVSATCGRVPRIGHQISRSGVGPPDEGTGNNSWVLWKNRKCP